MDAKHRARVEQLFEAALELPEAERLGWVRASANGDGQLESEVLALLDGHDRAGGLLDQDFRSIARTATGAPPAERRIGPYRLVRELGRGGMGVVYLAERDDGQFRRRVAIKLLRSGGDAEDLHARFLAERHILASLDHPNIAGLLDGGITDGLLPYLVMEYVEGLPITEYCDRHRLSLTERLRLFQHVCSAVHHAHRNLVIHRDLKPSNILVTSAGQVKLLDFGIAKLLNPALSPISQPVTRTEFRMLTPEFASPEQIRGDPLTTGTDIYSLGVLLYELLAGQSPYRTTRGRPQELTGAVLEDEPQRPSVRVVAIPRSDAGSNASVLSLEGIAAARGTTPERLRRRLRGDIDAIVLMALRKEPGRRYPSAELLAQDIEHHLGGEPVLAHRGSRWYRASKLLRRHAFVSAAAGMTMLTLVGGAAVAIRESRVAERERARAEAALEQVEQALEESREVTDFLMGLFAANDPAAAQGDQVTARELLERGVARSGELSGRPLLQARMLHVVGRVYMSLGRYARARELLESALAIRRGRLGDVHSQVAETLHSLANALSHEGRLTEAEPMLREALAIRREVLGPEDAEVGQTLNALAVLLHLRGDLEAAESTYRQALEVERRALGDEHRDVVRTESRLAVLLRDRGDSDGAEAMLQRTLLLNRKLYGDIHPEVASNLLQLGSSRLARQDARGADSLFRQTLEIRRRLYGEEHPAVAQSVIQLAMALADQREYGQADSLYGVGIAMQSRLLGTDHAMVGYSINSLGLLKLERGRLEDAERLFREALAIIRGAYGDHFNATLPLENLGRTVAALGRTSDAETIFRETLELRRRLVGERHPLVAQTSRRLADLLIQQQRLREAEPLLLDALGIHEERREEASAAEVRSELAELYTRLGAPEAAARYRSGAPR
jgi:eukaryotic-like serine/threonine-protein kinase